MRKHLLRGGSLVAALLLWQLLTSLHVNLWLHFDRLPTVVDVANDLGYQLRTSLYYQDIGDSLARILTGFALAALAGVAIGVAVGRSALAGDLVTPPLEVLRPIPAIAMVPIAILLFPSNEQGIVFITFVAAFFPIVVSTRHAVRALPVIWEEAVLTLGGGPARVLYSVVLPGILPGVFGGLSVGAGVSWICVISAEMISGRLGVGYRTWQAYTVLAYPDVFVGIITIGVLGFLTSAAVELIGRRATRWLPRGQENAQS
jgi:NitT/TauT family transport system permease protein